MPSKNPRATEPRQIARNWRAIAAHLTFSLYAVGHGIHQPCGQSGSVGPFAERAGTAASLSGFAMMAVASTVGLGRSMNGTVYLLTLGVGAFGACVAAVAWTPVQRHGAARGPAVAVATEMTV